MITEASVDPMARSICEYFDAPVSKRQKLSTSARHIGSQFDSKSRKAIFREQFNDLLDELTL
jgi:hypothetical protein